MFRKARLQLTILYSTIFLLLFWSLSAGIYLWMNRCFGHENGPNRYIHEHYKSQFFDSNEQGHESPGDIVMDELRNVLVVIDILLLFGVPPIMWFWTSKMLAPVQKSNEREKQFLTDASHDLRTPLSILSGELEVMLRKNHTGEEYKQALQSNKEEVDELVSLVENMLFFARENKEYQHMQKETIDLVDLITERIIQFQKIAKNKRITISFTPPEDAKTIKGNPQLLKRLITSLLENAVKYTPEKGKITVKITHDHQAVRISISDSGVGIPLHEQKKVFDRFYRLDTSRTEKGYGLGLSIAKKIVAFHDGNISIDAKTKKGTTFIIIFPIA